MCNFWKLKGPLPFCYKVVYMDVKWMRASIRFVLTEGEGGCLRNASFCVRAVLIGCVKYLQREGGGKISGKFSASNLMDAP